MKGKIKLHVRIIMANLLLPNHPHQLELTKMRRNNMKNNKKNVSIIGQSIRIVTSLLILFICIGCATVDQINPAEVKFVRFVYMPMGATTQFPIESPSDLLRNPHKDMFIYDREVICQYVSNINGLRRIREEHVKGFRIASYLEFANSGKRVFICTDDYADIYINRRRMRPDSAFVEYLNQLLNRNQEVSFEEMQRNWNIK